jgi:carboxyl-terminal processing protease
MIAGIRLLPESTGVKLQHASANHLGESKRLNEILLYIHSRYVDDVSIPELLDAASIALLTELDPHSGFIHSDELLAVNEQLEGNFDGIGIEFMIIEDTLTVVSVFAGGPAELAGIAAGDRIVAVNDSVIAGNQITNKDVFSLLRGNRGSDVEVSVYRPGLDELLPFNLKRDAIPIKSVDAAFMLDNDIGYFKINRFSANTYQEVMEHMERMIDNQGMKHLILDLRQNPGGYLQQASQLLSQIFSEKDRLMVYTQGKNNHRSDYESTGRNFFDIDKVAVLIDEGSASASEIMAGAIQDWDRGIIIGRRSFGKGLVQEQLYLSDGSALRLTIARYYTPSGRSIQKPYENINYDSDISNRLLDGELSDGNKVPIQDSTRFFTKLERRVVYGGGGIIPDVFIPMDSIYLNAAFIRLRSKISGFIFSESVSVEKLKLDYPTASAFIELYNPEQSGLLNRFFEFTKQSVEVDVVKEAISSQLKMQLARVAYGPEAFYRMQSMQDPFVDEAFKYLRQPVAELSAYMKQ